ncbi:MAG: hypothetical protein KGJ86_20920, partial [Chloroflexota bacterium]|nr:hypothetical protein [Chloroflexota bacterium]
PLSSLTPAECTSRAEEVLPQILGILGLDGAQATPAAAAAAAAIPAAAGPEPAGLTAQKVKDFRDVVEYYFAQGWTDGLPVVAVTAETVREFVEFVGRDPREVVATVKHLNRECTVEMAAVAAAMAGCRKDYLPLLLASLESMQPSIDTALMQSTTGQCQLMIVNGPIRRQLGFNGGGNVFGPGYRANATLGRAMRLVAMNAFGLRPGEFDQATQGTPAKYSFCIAENEEESPWEPLHVERGFAADANVITTHFARSTLHVENRTSNKAEEVLLTIAESMSYPGAWPAGRGCTVVMGPEHAQLVARQGWSKQQAKQFIWEHWGRTRGELRRLGLKGDGLTSEVRSNAAASEPADDEFVHRGESPDSILLVVAGARNAGVSAVVPAVRAMFHSKETAPPRG